MTLPVLRPGMLVGALFAFLSSFNEAVVVIFIGGRDAATLPRRCTGASVSSPTP